MFGVVGNVDQRGFVNQPRGATTRQKPHFLSGKEAAALLGVKRETLYAYASRGLVRSEPAGRGRERRYRREDLERLKARHDARAGHGPVAASALRWGEPVLESGITAIDARGPRYRGQLATDLAERAPFEAVAEFLWSGALPADPPAWRAEGLGMTTKPLAAIAGAARPIPLLALAIPALAAADPARFDASPEAEKQRARALILRLAALAGLGADPERARLAVAEPTVARVLLTALGARPTARSERALDRALVLLADHELNASTFTVRVAASVKADLYACFSAGMATLSGPRHGGECDRVEALLAEARDPEGARDVILARASRGEAVHGFGHTLYADGDPRAIPLLASAADLAPRSRAVRTALALAEATRDLGREAPTVDLALVTLAAALGLPSGSAAAIFAIGRTAGWVAHIFEQREQGFMLRPRARYVGP
jgi:citrate synthase